VTGPKRLLSPAEEMTELAARSVRGLLALLDELIHARVTRSGSAWHEAMQRAAAYFSRLTESANVTGRRRMELLAQRAAGDVAAEVRELETSEVVAALPRPPVAAVPYVEFREAVRDVIERTPEVAPGWEATAEVYTRHGFACARSTDVAVTERVREVIERTVRDGSVVNPRKVIAELGDWKRSYADTVYETNVRTAYTAGMFSRMADPAVARVLLGMRFVSAQLVTSRPNHVAAHGLTAPTDSHLWETFSPPMGYRCQCAIREISIFEAKRAGLIDEAGRLKTVLPPNFAAAHPDPGFGRGRPDRVVALG